MEISEETEAKILLALVSNTDMDGFRIRKIIDNVKDSASFEEAEALLTIGIALTRNVQPSYARKFVGWDEDKLRKFQKYIREEDVRCKDNCSLLCSINCIWFSWCGLCEEPICKLHDSWSMDSEDDCHKECYEVLLNIMLNKEKDKMNKIKFSHRYEKFNDIDTKEGVLLLEVFRANKKELSNDFILYDTTYYENGIRKHYPLPDGELLVLLFKDFNGVIFTTVRRYAPRKEEYYKNLRGEVLDIKILN